MGLKNSPRPVAQVQTAPSVTKRFVPTTKLLYTTPHWTRTSNLRFRRNGIFDSCSAFAVVKIMGNPGKRREFPPQTTPSLYSIFVQSQRRKPIFSSANPYSPTIFCENPSKTHTIFSIFRVFDEESAGSREIDTESRQTPKNQRFDVKRRHFSVFSHLNTAECRFRGDFCAKMRRITTHPGLSHQNRQENRFCKIGDKKHRTRD